MVFYFKKNFPSPVSVSVIIDDDGELKLIDIDITEK